MGFSAAVSKSSPLSSKVSKMSPTFGPAQCKKKLFSVSFPCFILYVHCQRINLKSFHVFSEARTHRSWIHFGIECSVIQVCIETSHFPRNRGTPRRQCEVANRAQINGYIIRP